MPDPFPPTACQSLTVLGFPRRTDVDKPQSEGREAALPHQAVLHVQHSNHSADSIRFEPVLLLADPLPQVQG